MQRSKPAQDHTSDAKMPSEIVFKPIGVVRSPYKERFGTPRQPNVTEQVLEDRMLEGTIELVDEPKFEQVLKGLEDFEYVWVIYHLHLNTTWGPLVQPPRGPKVKQGVFATRSPNRPNPIGLSACKLVGVDHAGRKLRLLGLDMLDGTPVLDIKPYVPYADAYPKAKAGWLDAIDEDMKGPDRFEKRKGASDTSDTQDAKDDRA